MKPHYKMDKIKEFLRYRMQAYPTPLNYKLSVGFYTEKEMSESVFLQTLIKDKFSNITVKERDRLVEIYDNKIIKIMSEIKGRVPEKYQLFFYDKINYKKAMQNARRSKEGYSWEKMNPIFTAIFNNASDAEIAPLCSGLPFELSNNIFDFNRYVRGVLG